MPIISRPSTGRPPTHSDIISDLLGGSTEPNRIPLWRSSSSSNSGSNFMAATAGFHDSGANNIEADYDLRHVVDVAIATTETASCHRPQQQQQQAPLMPAMLSQWLIHPSRRGASSLTPVSPPRSRSSSADLSREELDALVVHNSPPTLCVRPPLPYPPVVNPLAISVLEARRPPNVPPVVPAVPTHLAVQASDVSATPVNVSTNMRDPKLQVRSWIGAYLLVVRNFSDYLSALLWLEP